ncbi:efflux RND transporter periplasmic adaptor subunit [Acinetobacter qingfengensis]|nr:efflux RND transporter periplasmic adaptor subunit [Acinetobacter qingfengensis]
MTLVACQKSEDTHQQAETTEVQVSVIKIQPQTVVFSENLPARVQAYKVAEIRPQVGGIIEKVLFTQGSEVKAGQALFKINSEIFQADVNSNKAALAKAEAEVIRLKVQLDRYQQLLPSHAISKQELNNVQAQYRQALADVAQMRATLTRQNLNLQYATVRAPISGRIGKVLTTEGALVNQGDSNAMAVVQQLDKVYVDVTQSIHDYEKLQEEFEKGALTKNNQQSVQVLNSQGEAYPVSGRILFSDTNVDQNTGDIILRIEVNNPERKLLPGMYVRVNLNRASVPNALLVPEQAVQRDEKGDAQVIILNKNATGEARNITLAQQYKGYYIVTQGLNAGDTVIVEGLERITPQQKLKAIQWKAPSTVATNKTGGTL